MARAPCSSGAREARARLLQLLLGGIDGHAEYHVVVTLTRENLRVATWQIRAARAAAIGRRASGTARAVGTGLRVCSSPVVVVADGVGGVRRSARGGMRAHEPV